MGGKNIERGRRGSRPSRDGLPLDDQGALPAGVRGQLLRSLGRLQGHGGGQDPDAEAEGSVAAVVAPGPRVGGVPQGGEPIALGSHDDRGGGSWRHRDERRLTRRSAAWSGGPPCSGRPTSSLSASTPSGSGPRRTASR